ncbi:MAG: PDZ domain-containing protein [Planctomycetes bacterium]|nr:PDZ domain-containing protein [Planctomycetota bacterium]
MLSLTKKGVGILVAVVLAVASTGAVQAAPSLKITKVKPGSAAEDAGLVVGDVLLEIDGTAIHSQTALAQAIQQSGGDATILVAHTDGSTDTLEAFPNPTLGVQVKVVQLAGGGPVFFKKTLNADGGDKVPPKLYKGKKKLNH